jgi:hypothetical protein
LVVWDRSKFLGSDVFHNEFGHSIEFICKLTGEHWILTNIYALCTSEGKLVFLDRFNHIKMSNETK